MPIISLGSIHVVEAKETWRTGFYNAMKMQSYKARLDWRMVLSCYGGVALTLAIVM